MPFQSEAQRRFLFAKHPEIAKRWSHEYSSNKNLPMHKKSKSKKSMDAEMAKQMLAKMHRRR
jgi:hypothetical protein